VDTNCNPQGITYPIPGNDDAIRAITLFTQIVSNAVVEADNKIGLEVIDSYQDEDLQKQPDPEFIRPEDEEVETASISAHGDDEDDDAGFTTEDYSNYTPTDDKKEAAPAEDEVVATGIDEDKLYEE
jgi:small subunit ribosomal protein S2